MMKDYKIALVDDHTLFRKGMRGLLDRQEGYRVVAEAASGEAFLEQLPALEVDVVFMDIALPGINGAETTRLALEHKPDLRIITLSMFGDEQYYTLMVEAGACGFLLKDSAIGEVLEAIDTVAAGGNYFSHALMETISNRASRPETTRPEALRPRVEDGDALSARETEILLAVCRGLSNQEIADELFISKRTVDKHRANILEKTGCKNTASLVVYAIRHNLVEL